MTRSTFVRLLFGSGIALCSWVLAESPPVLSAGASLEASRPAPVMPIALVRQEVWQAVVAELRREGLSERELPGIGDIDLPGALPGAARRRVRVSSACWDDGPRRVQFRLECVEPGQCLPFLVYVHNADLDNNADDDQSANGRVGSCQPASPSRPPRDSLPNPNVRVIVRGTVRGTVRGMVRVGDRATAVFVSNRMRMAASVTCLERGGEGEVIRVRSQDGHVFRARISGPARLEALPQ